MKFIVAPMGSAGDVHPLVGVAKALEARGHEVVLIVLAASAATASKQACEPSASATSSGTRRFCTTRTYGIHDEPLA